ncbi:thiamine phosphate synthase [Sulfurospirillum arcachonense]|uniref:thiamine phosphate synthase n=1 Tax=Sulfurospirillum arcachonense TaxID=57666 RepID=UPI0004680D56|nr:thiamine phosphate synthase [Sulfurospirillum arcachonense]
MKLYALLDYESLVKKKWTIEKFVSTCNTLHVEMIQYRDKKGNIQRKIDNLIKLKFLCDMKVIINDEIDLVNFCDGLHVGQSDLRKIDSDVKEAIKVIRQKIGKKVLGISTHNKEEILEANELDIDYIGLGAYRTTSTKSDANVLKESLSDLARLSFKPVGAIGGVKVDDEIVGVTYAVVGSDVYEY